MDTTYVCDPCSFDIQDATIANLRHHTIKPIVTFELPDRLTFQHYDPAGTYDVLPLYNSKQIENCLKDYLSVMKNPCLRLRWQRFHVKPPTKYLKLEVLKYKNEPKPKVRHMILNGEPWAENGMQCYPVPTDPFARGLLTRNSTRKRTAAKSTIKESYFKRSINEQDE